MKVQGPFAKIASWQLAACLCTLRLPCHASSWLLFPLPCLFKSVEKRQDHSPNKFSGLRLARLEAQHAVSPVFYRSNWPLASKALSFYSNFRHHHPGHDHHLHAPRHGQRKLMHIFLQDVWRSMCDLPQDSPAWHNTIQARTRLPFHAPQVFH